MTAVPLLLVVFLFSLAGGYLGARLGSNRPEREELDDVLREFLPSKPPRAKAFTKGGKRKPRINDDKAAWVQENERGMDER